jgi:hypothetical protein
VERFIRYLRTSFNVPLASQLSPEGLKVDSDTANARVGTWLREIANAIFIDENGLSERPPRVRTWALRGQTPVLQYHFKWKVLSAAAGITWWNFYFRLYQRTIRAELLGSSDFSQLSYQARRALRRMRRRPTLVTAFCCATG